MNMLSSRFVVPIAIMLGVGGATAAWFEVHPHRHDPCQNPDTLAITSLIPGSKHVRQRDELPNDVIFWARGEFANPLSDENPFRYQIVRGYNTLRISTHPLSIIANDVDGESQRITEIDVGSQSLPIHIVEDFTKTPSIVYAYLQIYGNRPTASPIGAQIDGLQDVLLRGAQPVTTIIVDGQVTRKGLPVAEKAIGKWLGGAWTFFDRFCSAPAGEKG